MGTLNLGETTQLGTTDGGANDLKANKVILAKPGTALSMSIYWGIIVPGNTARLGIYDATGASGGAGTLIAATAEVTPVAGLQTYPLATPKFMSPANYWLCFLMSGTDCYGFATAVGIGYSDKTFTYAALPGTYGTPTASGTAWRWSMYATLTDGSILKPEGMSVPIKRSAFY